MKRLKHLKTAALLAILSLPLLSLADTDGSGTIQNPLGNNNTDLFKLMDNLILATLKVGSIIAVLAMIYAGFLFVTSSGDETKIKTAKKVLLYTVIGTAILLGAKVLSSVIVHTVENVGNATI